jgi:hypothetical protein
MVSPLSPRITGKCRSISPCLPVPNGAWTIVTFAVRRYSSSHCLGRGGRRIREVSGHRNPQAGASKICGSGANVTVSAYGRGRDPNNADV